MLYNANIKQKGGLQKLQHPRNITWFDKQLLLLTIKMQFNSTCVLTSSTAITTAVHPKYWGTTWKMFFHGLFLLINLNSKVMTQSRSKHRKTRAHVLTYWHWKQHMASFVNLPTYPGKVNSGTALNQITLFHYLMGCLLSSFLNTTADSQWTTFKIFK